MPLAQGDFLGPYQILERVGSGGMGTVWKASDVRLGRTVAIKQMAQGHDEFFLREARSIAALNHPHICTLFDIGPDYLVMEYIDGKPLAGPLPAAQALSLCIQLASALEAAHAKGLLHRDLKPANILVTSAGVAKLLDFGLAKFTGREFGDLTRTSDGVLMGTAGYMSPEQARGEPLDERSDIFSLGVVLFEAISGRRAFAGNSILDLLNAVVNARPVWPEASPEIVRIVQRAMSKPRSGRFQTMREFRLALESAVSPSALPEKPSVAVLPFSNSSRVADDEYFSDGLTEEIINALAQNSGLRVIARTSVFAFKGKNEDVRRIAERLGASAIVEGSVRRVGTRIRVTAELIDAADGSHLWAQRFDRDMTDVFALQDDVSSAIAGALCARLIAPRSRYIPDVSAYETYLKARYQHWKLAPSSMMLAKKYYDQAIAEDPRFALAYSARGDYLLFAAVAALISAREAAPLARLDAKRALELDPQLPEAHALLGAIAAGYDYDWTDAEVHFQRAMACSPVPAIVRHIYGFVYLRFLNRPRENLEQQRSALREDPLNLRYLNAAANALARLGRLDEAEAECQKILEIDAGHSLAYTTVASIYAAKGSWIDALAAMEKAHSTTSFNMLTQGALAGLLLRNGDHRGQEQLQQLGDGSAYGAPMGFVLAYLYAGETDSAFEWMLKAIDQRYLIPLHSVAGPVNLLRSSVHWPRIAKLMNLPDVVWNKTGQSPE